MFKSNTSFRSIRHLYYFIIILITTLTLSPTIVRGATFGPISINDQTPTTPLSNPTPSAYAPRYISGFGADDTFTIFFEDRDDGQIIKYLSTITGPTGFAADPTSTNISDTHFIVKNWPITIEGTPYQYRAWGAVGNNPQHNFYVSNDLTNWTLVNTFTIPNAVGFTGRGFAYYGFYDVILINGTYYAFSETNGGQTIIVRSNNGDDIWEAFASVGGTSASDGPLQMSDSGTPSGSFMELGLDCGYGIIRPSGDDSAFFFAVNTVAKKSLTPAQLESAFINPSNWTWHDGTIGLPSTPIVTSTAEHDLREVWIVPNSNPNDNWTLIYTADYGVLDGGKALGYAVGGNIDTTPPTGSITIDSGETYTPSSSVSLTLSCTDTDNGCYQMCISNTPSCSTWESYSTTKVWTLTSGDGTKSVYVWFEDCIGNINGTSYSDSIILDETSPSTIALPGSGTYSSSQSVALSCDDGSGSGCGNIYYTTDGSDPSTGSTVYSSAINISTNTTLKFFAVDLAGYEESMNTEAYVFVSPLTITTSSLPSGSVPDPYDHDLTATGGVQPYSWSISSGTLPDGLNLNGTTSKISGNPTAKGTFNFTVQVTDQNLWLAVKNLSINIQSYPVKISSSYYSYLQSAYDGCFNGNTIQIQSLEFLGDFICDRNVSIMLKGGYDTNFLSNPSYTTINGTLTISNGTVEVENLIIK